MKKTSISIIYDSEWNLPLPNDLLYSMEVDEYYWKKSWQETIPPGLELSHGAGPEIAAIVIAITSPFWEYAVEKLLDGLIKIVKSKWFSTASSKADEAKETGKENNIFSRARDKKIKEAAIPDWEKRDDPFPYALMNIAISSHGESSNRFVQILFPYPMTDVEAEKAVSELKGILDKVQPNSAGVMYFDKLKSKWVLQRTIKLYKK
jgi:hypothetical protein